MKAHRWIGHKTSTQDAASQWWPQGVSTKMKKYPVLTERSTTPGESTRESGVHIKHPLKSRHRTYNYYFYYYLIYYQDHYSVDSQR